MEGRVSIMLTALMISIIFGMYTTSSAYEQPSCCPSDQSPCSIVNVTKDESRSNRTHHYLLCSTCSQDEDAMTYWMVNGTFPEYVDGMSEGQSVANDLGEIYRELNVTDPKYIGYNVTCVLLGSYGTSSATITLQ